MQSANPLPAAGRPVNPPNVFTFTTTAGTGTLIALATTDGGAIVAGTVLQPATVTPGDAGAKVVAEGDVHVLSGVDRSDKGYATVYGGEMLFYVPPLASNQQIKVLGYAAGILSSKELP